MSIITRPLLAVTIDNIEEFFRNNPNKWWYASVKLDGIRGIKDGGQAKTRTFKPIPNNHIRQWMEVNLPDGMDGEIIIPNMSFNETQSIVMSRTGTPNFTFYAFDWVHLDLNEPFHSRLYSLMEFGKTRNFPELSIVPQVPVASLEEFLEFERTALSLGYEGVILRHPDGIYKNGRSTLRESILLKFKRFSDSEAIVEGFIELRKNENDKEVSELGLSKRSSKKANLKPANTLGALVVRDLATGDRFEIGTGFKAKDRQEIWDNMKNFLGKIVTYTYQKSGSKDLPRFPSFKGFRDIDDIGGGNVGK